MQLSDTTNKNGLLQECEHWCGFDDGGITGDTTLKAQFVARLDRAIDKITPRLLSITNGLRFDGTNDADLSVATFDIASGTSDYRFTVDDNNLDILNIVGISILPDTTTNTFLPLDEMTLDDPMAQRAMSPNPSDTGVPTKFLKKGLTAFLFPQPNYDRTDGGKLYFERRMTYFVGQADTFEPGIPLPFQQLLDLYASEAWLVVNKSDNGVLIANVRAEIKEIEHDLDAHIRRMYPTRRRINGTGASTRSR